MNYKVLLFVSLFAVTLAKAENWMNRLPDNTYVSELSIPGSHDSATGHGFTNSLFGLFGDSYAKTQELTIQQQWDAGIRAFDFRPALYADYINANHGLVPTKLRFNDALYMLRDLLRDNPSEFVIIHLLHASEGDDVSDNYGERLLELLNNPDLRDYFVDFRKDLCVSDLRGKILLLSRDEYATTPVGGFFNNWSGSADWSNQTGGQIVGPDGNTGRLYMQDYSDTHGEGGIDTKITSMTRLLKFSTRHKTTTLNTILWVFNLTSAYSKVDNLFGNEISTSDGYRDNATHTHAAFLDFLAAANYVPGPTGIVLMDYAGVDWSGDYYTRGKEMVDKIIENNFLYLNDVTTSIAADRSTNGSSLTISPSTLTLSGTAVKEARQGGLYLVNDGNGQVRKMVFR